jgi:DNA-directed RNA polymerase specialized sigma24 family protein
MESVRSVTGWLAQLKEGNQAAAQPLWEKYFSQLLTRARRKLAGAQRRSADEEDVALSAFDSFCRAADAGRFPRLNDRDDLWQLLVVLTDRKAVDLIQYERRQRRGSGKVLDEAALKPGDSADDKAGLAEAAGEDPSPAFAVQAAEEFERLLGLLEDPQLQQAAILKMEGYTVEEIAVKQGRVPRTVRRWLRLIRQVWEGELERSD